MVKQGTILVVDDNKGVLNALEMLLSGVFREVITIPVRWMWCCWI